MRLSACLLILGATACANAPISFHSPTPDTGDAAYACALRKVNELGYTVTNANKEARFITGERQTSGVGTQLLTGKKYHDQLTVSVFDADSTSRTMRVTAASVAETSNIFATSKTGIAPSDKAQADAGLILNACTKGVITKEGGAAQAPIA